MARYDLKAVTMNHQTIRRYLAWSMKCVSTLMRPWHSRPAVHLASYSMWRINWIHPFFGGNGRTARAASYLILCAKLGFALPGEITIPELIVENREPYYSALRSADAAWAGERKLDISTMEQLMEDLLAEQLVGIHEKATGKKVVQPEAS